MTIRKTDDPSGNLIQKSTVKRKKLSDIELSRLINETDCLCPICGHRILDDKNGKINKFFHIAHIYPHSPSPEQRETLKNVPRPYNDIS